ncbi:MAG: TrmH family RNA methyltransferase [Deltaproteobacteria bacterium]
MKISSIHNQNILALRKLFKNNERKNSDVFITEGKKEVARGINSGYELLTIYFSPEIITKNELSHFLSIIPSKTEIFYLDKLVYEKLAYRDNTEGIIGLFKKKTYTLNDINPGAEDIVLILESIEKPGNLGAILRSADAAGIKAIILTETVIDQYNPNVIRSSLGAVFEIPVILSSNKDVRAWLTSNRFTSFSAALPSYKNLFELDFSGNIAFIFGSEANGLSDFWLDGESQTFTIPMKGIVDSLNVSVSVAVTIYEAIRQKKSY